MNILGTGPIYSVNPKAEQTTFDYSGFPLMITYGTLGAEAISNDNPMSRLPRVSMTQTIVGFRSFTPIVIPADTTGGGFRFRLIFGLDDVNVLDDFRCFFGLSTSLAVPLNVEPDSLTQILGVGCTGGDGTKVNDRFSIFSAGTSAQAGVAMPDNGDFDIAVDKMWELIITSPADTTKMYMAFREHGNHNADTERTTHDLVAATRVGNTTPLTLWCYASNGPSAGNVAISFLHASWETSV